MNDYSLSNVDQISVNNSQANLSHKLTPRGSLRHGSAQLDGPRKIIIDGNYAYIMSHYGNSLEIVDVSNPNNPTFVRQIARTTTIKLGAPRGMDIA